MRIALAQLDPTSGDIDGNTQKVLDAITEATARGAELLVTPEMCIPGYCIGDLVEDAGFLAANERAIQRIAAAATDLTAVVGFIEGILWLVQSDEQWLAATAELRVGLAEMGRELSQRHSSMGGRFPERPEIGS